MRYNNEELVRMFANRDFPEDDPDNRHNHRSNLHTEELQNGDVALIGYNWQTLAINSGGQITLFEGWEDWAWEQYSGTPGKPTTARHIELIREVAEPDREVGVQRQAGSPPNSVRQIGSIGMLD